ncbi:hypothetical protein [Stenotrophomonas maltophilia group sp. Smal13]|uniref:hypothetical protein n=1 Tax=Stenotrophomonas maltophilia group sp. Smal13 TaxID=3377166 RepID=UPI0025547DA9|nr:hypothetical protein [Stenotrophomonas maltophilia]
MLWSSNDVTQQGSRPKTKLELKMKHHAALYFRTAMTLDELAEIIEMENPFFDCENEDEWVIGVCEGVDKIDVCRTHKVPPIETDTAILRYAHAMESAIPTEVLKTITSRLLAHGITDIKIRGFDKWGTEFLFASAATELGL